MGKPLRIEASWKGTDWMPKVLDKGQAKKCTLCLEGTGRVSEKF